MSGEKTQQQSNWEKRQRRVAEVIRKGRHVRAADALTDLWHARASGRPDAIKVRPYFVHRWHPGKDEQRTVPPLLPDLITSRGIALRFYLLALYTAQCLGTSTPHKPGLAFTRATEEDLPGWVDLIALDVAYHRASGVYEPRTRTDRDFISAYKRQITAALRFLQDRGLVKVSSRNDRYRYLDFTLMDERGRGAYNSTRDYTVPDAGIDIPKEFFTSGWINALSPSEIATWLALRALKSRLPGSHDRRGVFLYAQTRIETFGLKKDTYQDSCRMLVRLGLLEDVTDDPDPAQDDDVPATEPDQPPALFLSAADLAEEETYEGPYKPKRYKFTDKRLNDDGIDAVHTTLTELIAERERERTIAAHRERRRQNR